MYDRYQHTPIFYRCNQFVKTLCIFICSSVIYIFQDSNKYLFVCMSILVEGNNPAKVDSMQHSYNIINGLLYHFHENINRNSNYIRNVENKEINSIAANITCSFHCHYINITNLLRYYQNSSLFFLSLYKDAIKWKQIEQKYRTLRKINYHMDNDQ